MKRNIITKEEEEDGYNISPPPPKKRPHMYSANTYSVNSRVWVNLTNLPLGEGGDTDGYTLCYGKATIVAINDGNSYRVKFDNPEIHNEVDLFDVDHARVRLLNSTFPIIDTPQVRKGVPVLVHSKLDMWWDATIVSEAPDAENAVTIKWKTGYSKRNNKAYKKTARVPLCFVRLKT